MIAAAGSAGLGAVWGWLLGARARPRRHLTRSALAAGAATLLLAAEVAALAGSGALVWLVGAAASALAARVVLWRVLARRYDGEVGA